MVDYGTIRIDKGEYYLEFPVPKDVAFATTPFREWNPSTLYM